MRTLVAAAVLLVAGLGPAAAQDLPACETLLTADEIRATCGVPEAAIDHRAMRDGRCRITAQRDGAVSGLTVDVYVDENAQTAAATVGLARAMGQSAGERPDGSDMANRAMGQVFELLGAQDTDAEAAEAVSADEAALQDLPDLGDGGVRYVGEAAAGMGLVTHTVVFSDGATVVKLESGIVAGRAGVCTVGPLETLARRVASRL